MFPCYPHQPTEGICNAPILPRLETDTKTGVSVTRHRFHLVEDFPNPEDCTIAAQIEAGVNLKDISTTVIASGRQHISAPEVDTEFVEPEDVEHER